METFRNDPLLSQVCIFLNVDIYVTLTFFRCHKAFKFVTEAVRMQKNLKGGKRLCVIVLIDCFPWLVFFNSFVLDEPSISVC
jgi:hypothetical protein